MTASSEQEGAACLPRPVRLVVVHGQRGLGGVDIYTTNISPEQCTGMDWIDPGMYQCMFHSREADIMLAVRFSNLVCPVWTGGDGAFAAYDPIGGSTLPAATHNLPSAYSVFNAIVPATASYILLVAVADNRGSDYGTDYSYDHPTVQEALAPYLREWRAECTRGKRAPFARYMDASRDREAAHDACLRAINRSGAGWNGFDTEYILDALYESLLGAKTRPLKMLLSPLEVTRLECIGFRCEKAEAADFDLPRLTCTSEMGIRSFPGAVKDPYRVTLARE